MDLAGIPKLAWRERLMIAHQKTTSNKSIPKNNVFFTLGASALSDDSELNHLVFRGFITPKQYVSTERDHKIHLGNTKIKGPTWLHGQLEKKLLDWFRQPNMPQKNIAFLNADIMSGIEVALPVIKELIDIMYDNNNLPGRETILAVNVLEHNRWAENRGYTFSPVYPTIQKDSCMKRYMRDGLTLIDRFTYENKTVGNGRGVSQLTTLIFHF